MHTCKKCHKKIPSTAIINNKRRSLTGRRYCLVCNPYGLRPNKYGIRHQHNDEEVKKAVAKSFSYAGVLKYLGLNVYGSAYATIKKRIAKLSLNTTHFTGQAHLRGGSHNWSVKYPLNEVLIKHSSYVNSNYLKKRLVKEGLIVYRCADCGIKKWNGKPLSLQLEHCNGNHWDNRLENLKLLCPNCHSQTKTFCKIKRQVV